MTILDIAILIFVVMELSNVLVMYFKPDFKYANSMAVLNNGLRVSRTKNNVCL